MNHLIKVIQFYKSLKTSDLITLSNIIKETEKSYYFEEIKRIKIDDFIFVYFSNNLVNTDMCCYCFSNIYKDNIIYIPLYLYNRNFYLRQAKKQILNINFEIIDIVHFEIKNDRSLFFYIKDILDLFPSFMIIKEFKEHNHFLLGLTDAPILSKDATLHYEDIYLVDWYLPTFMIKDLDLEQIILGYNTLLNKYKNTTPIIVMFKRANKYYLYLIFTNISCYEALGYFIPEKTNEAISKEIEIAKNKLKKGRAI